MTPADTATPGATPVATPAVDPAVVALVDDAGIFPPTRLPMADALARHRRDEAAGSPVLTDRFLVAASRVGEMLDLLDDAPLDVGLVVDVPLDEVGAVLDRLRDDARTTVRAVEVRLDAGATAAGSDDPAAAVAAVADALGDALGGAGVPVHVEIPSRHDPAAALAAVADAGLGAKVRCGGVTPDLFPTSAELARFLDAAVRAGVPVKATAGLHHAVRYVDPRTGFRHHGFLNILAATLRAVAGRPQDDLVAALDSDDGAALAAEVRDADAGAVRALRERFVAYGSCDTGLPVTDLHDLGLA